MPLPDQLLEQARHLATRDTVGRPRQENLRRAVSAAYYALFHFLIDQACGMLLGAAGDGRRVRGVLARAFDHSSMRRTCVTFASGNVPNKLRPALLAHVVPADLRAVATAFETLQDQRHAADYDRLRRFVRIDVLLLIAEAERAIQRWPAALATDVGRVFLLGLLVGDRIRE